MEVAIFVVYRDVLSMYKQLFFLFSAILPLLLKAQDPQLVRGPYLQVVTANSIVIRWRTDLPSTGKVIYGTSQNNLNQSVEYDFKLTDHEVKLSNLLPNTRYFYAFGQHDGTLKHDANQYFKTAPAVGSTQKVRIWAMGDMGDGSENQRRVRDSYLVHTIEKHTDMLLLLGDNAYGAGLENEYQVNFFQQYQPFNLPRIPMWSVPGNHEYYAASRTTRNIPYYQIFTMPTEGQAGGVPSGTEAYYSFDYANIHFVALDSDGIEDQRYRLYNTDSPQVNWLKKDLAANRLPWTIVMFHHPPYTKNSHDSDYEEELALIRQHITPILDEFKVDLVLNGHSHIYERSRPIKGHTGYSNTYNNAQHAVSTSSGRYDNSANSCAYIKGEGTIYAVVGSSGRLGGYSGPPHPISAYHNVEVGGSLMIEIEDNRLDAKWITTEDKVRDQFTIFKNVNKTTNLTIKPNEPTSLRASWNGQHQWSNGTDNQPNITIQHHRAGEYNYSVKDPQGCLTDQFKVTVTGDSLTPNPPSNSNACAVNKIRLKFRADCCFERLNGATIQGSNDGINWNLVYAIRTNGTGSWQEFSFENTIAYQQVRFVAGPNGYGELLELEFYNNSTKLTGTAFGSKDYNGNDTDGGLKALDGNEYSFWHGAVPGSANFAGLVLANCTDPLVPTPPVPNGCVVNRVRLKFREDCCLARLSGATIQGSKDEVNWVNLHTITSYGTGNWQDFSFSNTQQYKYVRFVAGSDGYGELYEIEFYNNNDKLSGIPFGSKDHSGNDADGGLKALDGRDDNGIWHGSVPGSANYAGLVLNCSSGRIGVDKNKTAANKLLIVTPNPSNGEFEVVFDLPKTQKGQLSVVDEQGRVYYQKNLIGKGQQSEKINLMAIRAGTYIVRLDAEAEITTEKIVVVH
jgi:predicted phosphohydrolase